MKTAWYVVLALLSSFIRTEGINRVGGGECTSKYIPSSLSRKCKNFASDAGNASRRNESVITHSPRTGTAAVAESHSTTSEASRLPRGGAAAAAAAAAAAFNPFPAGYNPFGFGLTDLGRTFLDFDGSIDSDVGRFLSTLKSGGGKRKSASVLKDQWLEIVRVSKTGQSMRIYRRLDDMIEFCLKAGLVD